MPVVSLATGQADVIIKAFKPQLLDRCLYLRKSF